LSINDKLLKKVEDLDLIKTNNPYYSPEISEKDEETFDNKRKISIKDLNRDHKL
jgi:hypothetical protein